MGDQPRILVVLESSDERALRTDYPTELFKTNTGRTLLKAFGKRISEVEITNSIKCLFHGRKPRAGEYRNCRPNLKDQVQRGGYDLVIGMGQFAQEALNEAGVAYIAYPHPRRMTIIQKQDLARQIGSI